MDFLFPKSRHGPRIDENTPFQILLVGLFLLGAWNSTWFEITASGTYSEGLDREPTIRTEYIIDNSQETFELSIENSTPLILYWLQREDVSPDSTNQEPVDSESSSQDIPERSDSCSGSCLDQARDWVAAVMVALFASLCLSLYRPSRLASAAVTTIWLIGTVVILAALPLSIAADFGISDDGEESSTGGFDTNTQETVSVDQFAHFEADSSMGMSFDGISFYYQSLGFDLGLLPEDERQQVIDSAPSEDESGYESLIGFNGKMTVGPGPILWYWVLIAGLSIPRLTAIILPGRRETLEEE